MKALKWKCLKSNAKSIFTVTSCQLDFPSVNQRTILPFTLPPCVHSTFTSETETRKEALNWSWNFKWGFPLLDSPYSTFFLAVEKMRSREELELRLELIVWLFVRCLSISLLSLWLLLPYLSTSCSSAACASLFVFGRTPAPSSNLLI